MTEQELLEHIKERLTWIKEACEIDRDAEYELLYLVGLVEARERIRLREELCQ